jgi:hypothetical protein
MRRHIGWKSENLTPSKERLRKRLFQSPQKSSLFVIPSSHHGSACRRFPKKAVFIVFTCFAVILCFGLPTYLFHFLLQSNAIEQRDAAFRPERIPRASEPSILRGFQASPKKQLEPLRPIDVDQYTIRINTWRRPEQLLISVDHHASCPGVAQIQVVWCDKEEEPPAELYNYTNVIIERHQVNSLNERFNILSPTPTLGILSIDDDVLRPCEAIDAGFFKWTRSPDRMIGFDARVHVENENGQWQVSLE